MFNGNGGLLHLDDGGLYAFRHRWCRGWLICLPSGGPPFDVGLFDFGVDGDFELDAAGLLSIESFQTSFLSRANVGKKFAVTAKGVK